MVSILSVGSEKRKIDSLLAITHTLANIGIVDVTVNNEHTLNGLLKNAVYMPDNNNIL